MYNMIKRPYNNTALLKWTAFAIERNEWNKEKPYTTTKVTLQELVKIPAYAKFKDRLNWLYKNYTPNNYDIVWKELQEYNLQRQEQYIQEEALLRSNYSMKFQIQEAIEYYGPIPDWIKALPPDRHECLLERAKLLYEIEPDYEAAKLDLKDIYTVPQREVMDYLDSGTPIYWELQPSVSNHYVTVVGNFECVSPYLKKIAEQAAIRDAHWIAKNCPEFKVADSIEDILYPEE